MRVIVTGASGFAGRHLIRELEAFGHKAYGFDRTPDRSPLPSSRMILGDVCDFQSLVSLAHQSPSFDACIHLAGVAFVPLGWTDPVRVFHVNTLGVLHLLEAFRQHAPNTQLVIVTSAEIYGQLERNVPVRETDPPRPSSPYAVAKLSADLLALLYARKYGIPVMTARPGNHIGPGQSQNFSISSFARQLAEIRAGRRPPVIEVGNLQSERCFLDVRDTVRAYRLLAERGRPGRAYNIGSPQRITLEHALNVLCELAGIQPQRHIAPSRYRPTDSAIVLDTSLIREDVGWNPTISLRETLSDILDDWTHRIASEETP